MQYQKTEKHCEEVFCRIFSRPFTAAIFFFLISNGFAPLNVLQSNKSSGKHQQQAPWQRMASSMTSILNDKRQKQQRFSEDLKRLCQTQTSGVHLSSYCVHYWDICDIGVSTIACSISHPSCRNERAFELKNVSQKLVCTWTPGGTFKSAMWGYI